MSITSRINEMSTHIEQAYDELQGLGADLTNVNKNIENISMVLDDIYDSMPQVSGEGTSLTLDDTRVGKIKSTLKGNTSQSGTPTPTSPIPINVVSGDNEINVVGKNILDSKNLASATYNGISFTPVYENGLLQYINVNGTATSDASYSSISSGKTPYANRTPITPNVTHYCSGCPSNGSTSTYFISYYYYNDTNTYLGGVTDTGNGATINNANAYYVASYITIKPGTTMNNAKFYPMVSTLSDNVYDAYNIDTYNIDLPVENLFDKSNITWSRDNGIIYNSVYVGVGTYTMSSPNMPYDSSGKNMFVLAGNVSSGANSNTNGVDKDTPRTITTTDGYITIANRYILSNTLNLNHPEDYDWQIEKGSKANSYTPYGTTPIELCSSKDGTKRDYLLHDKTLDKWYLHKEIGKVVLSGSETVDKVANGKFRATQSINFGQYGYGTSNQMYSNYFKNKADYGSYTTGEGYAWNYYIYFGLETSVTTTTDAQTWLTNNTPTFYGILATPTTTEITYQPLIDQLNELEKAMSKDGQTNISQVNNDLPFIISASALKEWQESASLNSTLSMVNPLSLGNTLNTQENNTQPIEVDNIEPLEEEENEES